MSWKVALNVTPAHQIVEFHRGLPTEPRKPGPIRKIRPNCRGPILCRIRGGISTGPVIYVMAGRPGMLLALGPRTDVGNLDGLWLAWLPRRPPVTVKQDAPRIRYMNAAPVPRAWHHLSRIIDVRDAMDRQGEALLPRTGLGLGDKAVGEDDPRSIKAGWSSLFSVISDRHTPSSPSPPRPRPP
jgi:hypothetical protein